MDKTLKYLFLLFFTTTLLYLVGSQPMHSAVYYGQGVLFSQLDSLTSSDSAKNVDKKYEKIYVEADISSYIKAVHPDAQILKGHVKFRHKDAVMMCDSALLFQKENRLIAFSNVNIYQGDSIHISCNWLEYDGISLLSRLRENVQMEQGQTTLFTDSLDYSRATGIGYYFDSGTIVDSLNQLSSIYGEYSTVTKNAFFEDSVTLVNPNFTLKTSRLDYNTESKVANITKYTTIKSDSGKIITDNGVYDTGNDVARLYNRSKVYSGNKIMTADTIFYLKKDSLAKLYGHIDLVDTLERKSLHGGYAEYRENIGSGLARDRAYVVDYASKDTLWAHAKLLFLERDTTKKDIVKGIDNVRVYRKDVQAVSDSMVYTSRDSLLTLYGLPVMWNNDSQVLGDTVKVQMSNGKPKIARVINNAFVAMQIEKNKYYNQMKGNEILAYFKAGNIDSVRTNGNAETIYYTQEKKDSVVTIQFKIQSASIKMNFSKDKIENIKFYGKTKGVGTPVKLLQKGDYNYPGFYWFEQGRPKNFEDIFMLTPARGSSTLNTDSVPMNGSKNLRNQVPLNGVRSAVRNNLIQDDTQGGTDDRRSNRRSRLPKVLDAKTKRNDDVLSSNKDVPKDIKDLTDKLNTLPKDSTSMFRQTK